MVTLKDRLLLLAQILIRISTRFSVSLALAIVLQASAVSTSAAASNAADLSYGRALYSYYQQDYLTALSELVVARQRNGGGGHGDFPLLLQGTISLAYGMERQAAGLFYELANSKGPGSPRNPICLHRCRSAWISIPSGTVNAAWFYHGKLLYERGSATVATGSFNRIFGPINQTLLNELVALQVNIALSSGHTADAEKALAGTMDAGPWQPYIYYNIGTAYLKAGDFERGLIYLDRLAELPAATGEYLALRDKALNTVAYGLLAREDYATAITYFQRVRTESPLVANALLGYGWANAGLKNYQQALIPWRKLSSIQPIEPPGQEAMLAVPYALEKLGQNQQAMSSLNQADRFFSDELKQISTFLLDIEKLGVLAALESIHTDKELENRSLVLQMLLDSRIRSHLQKIADLQGLRQRLDYWQDNLSWYRENLDKRDAAKGVDSPLILANEITQSVYRPNSHKKSTSTTHQNTDAILAPGTERRSHDQTQTAPMAFAGSYSSHQDLAVLNQALRRPEQRQAQMYSVTIETPDKTSQLSRLERLDKQLQQQWKAQIHSEKRVEKELNTLITTGLHNQQMRLQYYQRQARLARVRIFEQASL